MKGRKRTILTLCVVASVLAGCNKAATAQERQGDEKTAEAAPSVEFYYRNFGERLNTEVKCLKNPELAKTDMCINVRKAANRIRTEGGMQPKYPEVENGDR
ncbi:EexN family lipoprotein [Ochrobactrum sp. Kaboul]|nr:EexN family lipoprotein [Brucella anthropi]KAB2692452.1 EexN family lipoprotein [Ochrobactrum sp. Kaboul]